MTFATLYTLGNVIALAGTGFLMGFRRQCKSMFKKVRVVATIMFLGCLVMTVVSAMILNNGLLTLLFVIL